MNQAMKSKLLCVWGGLMLSCAAQAVDSNAVLGGAVGGAVGAAIGSAVGGREGAIIGAGVGGAVGVDRATGGNAGQVQTGGAASMSRAERRENRRHSRRHKNEHEHGDSPEIRGEGDRGDQHERRDAGEGERGERHHGKEGRERRRD
jgi:hypothetical protein